MHNGVSGSPGRGSFADAAKEGPPFKPSEFRVGKGLLVEKTPTKKIGELILKSSLTEPKILAVLSVKGKEAG